MALGLLCNSLHADRFAQLRLEIGSHMVLCCVHNATARLVLLLSIFHRLLPLVPRLEPRARLPSACTEKVKQSSQGRSRPPHLCSLCPSRKVFSAACIRFMFTRHHGATSMRSRTPFMPLLPVRVLILFHSIFICGFLGSYLRRRGDPYSAPGDQSRWYLCIDALTLPGFLLLGPAFLACLALLGDCDVTARVKAGISNYLASHETSHFCRLSPLLLALLVLCPLKSEAFGYMSSIAAAYGDPGFFCAIKASDQQQVYCWRRNATIAGGAFDGPENIGFAGLSGGRGIMCGLQADSYQPYCWLSNNTQLNTVPTLYAKVAYSSIAAGDSHVCAVRGPSAPNPGKVDCWGSNASGESSPPATLMSSVVAGRNFTCGVTSLNQAAVCWGSSVNHVTDSVPPVTFQSLAAGANHMCGIVNGTGQARCWGDNSMGQSGHPSLKFAALAGGFSYTCGIREDTHEVLCWGDSSFNVSLDSRFLAITGGEVSCGVSEEKLIVECWGNGTAYEPPLQLFSPGLCTRRSCQQHEFYFNASEIGVKASLCADPTQKICSPCAESCPVGSYVSMNCTADSNMKCISCSECQNQDCQNACSGKQARSASSAPVNGPEPNTSLTGGPQVATIVSAEKSTGIGVIIGVAAGGGLLVFLVGAAVAFCLMLRRRGRYLLFACGSDSERTGQNGLIHLSSSLSSSLGSSGLGRGGDIVIRTQAFRLTELRDATNGFKEVNELGRGNYGFVYKATLLDGRHVAVKRASAARRIQSNSRDFEAELEILCKLHHANLVNLLGYCEEMGERLLVYEFMPHGTLHDHLHGGLAVLSWGLRIKIALQAARGIEYLHKDASPRIWHKDIKSSNILLDGEWGARVADFGLSLPGNEKGAPISAPQVTEHGYLDPEYLQTQTFTDKSDVYSFGVVLLEILCGRRVHDSGYDPPYIVDWAVPLIHQGRTVTVLDCNLEPPKNVDGLCRIAEIAELCVRSASCERPGISDVAGWLEQVARSSPL